MTNKAILAAGMAHLHLSTQPEQTDNCALKQLALLALMPKAKFAYYENGR